MKLKHLFDSSKIDAYSRFAVRLHMGFEGEDGKTAFVSWGSGFIVRDSHQRNFLITAWHNLSGREPETGKAKDPKTLCFPNKVEIHGVYNKTVRKLYGASNNPNNDPPYYWRHPTGPHIDVAALLLDGDPWEYAGALDISNLNQNVDPSMWGLHVSQECFLVGYPLGLADKQKIDTLIPIRKTGHLASEPSLDFCGDPVYIVDAITRPGMSGCVVLVETVKNPRLIRLLGVYGGRLGKPEHDSHLAFVYKSKTITEILATGPNHIPPVYRLKDWGAD